MCETRRSEGCSSKQPCGPSGASFHKTETSDASKGSESKQYTHQTKTHTRQAAHTAPASAAPRLPPGSTGVTLGGTVTPPQSVSTCTLGTGPYLETVFTDGIGNTKSAYTE